MKAVVVEVRPYTGDKAKLCVSLIYPVERHRDTDDNVFCQAHYCQLTHPQARALAINLRGAAARIESASRPTRQRGGK